MPIYARTSGDVYKAVSKILTADGSEIGKVVDSTGRIIYEASRLITVTGVPPISFTKSIGKPLVSWDLLGNAQQTGTPSPDNIIMPEMCGVRTGNLVQLYQYSYKQTNHYYVDYNTVIGSSGMSDLISTINAATDVDDVCLNFETDNKSFTPNLHVTYEDGTNEDKRTPPFVINKDKKVSALIVRARSGSSAYDGTVVTVSNFMLNLGSTALPYEPYGYKIPFNNHGDNMCDQETVSTTRPNVNLVQNTEIVKAFKSLTAGEAYTLSWDFQSSSTTGVRDVFRLYSGATYMGVQINNGESFTLTENQINDLTSFVVYFGNNGGTMTDFMLNAGSTALPYSPYFSETVPVYLGQTPTVRRVKKFVLDGTEDWRNSGATAYLLNLNALPMSALVCTHFKNKQGSGMWNGTAWICLIRLDIQGFENLDTWKSYLAAQYAAGTPVTVWYTLEEPETAIVNEPLAKIGDYADELHSTDAGVTIPTTKGDNALTVETDLQPSSMTIVYKGR